MKRGKVNNKSNKVNLSSKIFIIFIIIIGLIAAFLIGYIFASYLTNLSWISKLSLVYSDSNYGILAQVNPSYPEMQPPPVTMPSQPVTPLTPLTPNLPQIFDTYKFCGDPDSTFCMANVPLTDCPYEYVLSGSVTYGTTSIFSPVNDMHLKHDICSGNTLHEQKCDDDHNAYEVTIDCSDYSITIPILNNEMPLECKGGRCTNSYIDPINYYPGGNPLHLTKHKVPTSP